MHEGDKVTYIPFDGADKTLHEKGIVKSVTEHCIFVVFHCNDLWSTYRDYVGQSCNKENLIIGWYNI